MNKIKIIFKRLDADLYCTPIGVNENGHVIYKVDMDKGQYLLQLDEEDNMFSYTISYNEKNK